MCLIIIEKRQIRLVIKSFQTEHNVIANEAKYKVRLPPAPQSTFQNNTKPFKTFILPAGQDPAGKINPKLFIQYFICSKYQKHIIRRTATQHIFALLPQEWKIFQFREIGPD